MNQNGDGSVVLLDKTSPVAILTQSDIINAINENMDLSIKAYSVASKSVVATNENRPIEVAFTFLNEHNIRRIVLVDDHEQFVGIVLQENLFDYMEENLYKVDLEVSHIINTDRIIVTINKAASLYDALQLMKDHHVGSVIVVDRDNVVGILTEKDILKLIYLEINIKDNIEKHMSKPVVSVRDDALVINAISLIRRKNIRRILVVDSHNDPIDILSNHDILKHLKGKRQAKEHLLLQQSRHATMGEMIGHIAHQWRQPLAQLGGVFMNLDAAYEFDELNKDYLQDKVKNGNDLIKYMSNTIEDFRNFFMPNDIKEVFDLNQYIQSACNIIQATLSYHHIRLEVISLKEPILVSGYPSEFSQVIFNLLNNSKDILLERATPSPKIKIEIKLDAGHVVICVKDNGGGIDKSIINRIFEIYFSTKINDGGSGLGLYISKLIIENKFFGDLYVLNGEEGAEFFIKLPTVEAEA